MNPKWNEGKSCERHESPCSRIIQKFVKKRIPIYFSTYKMKLLEGRLDNVIYRMGFAPTRRSARQLVSHGHFKVNTQKVNIPSYHIKSGDVVTVRDKSKQLDIIHNAMKRVKDASMYPWVNLDKAAMSGTFIRVPEREEVPLLANEQLVVELYSK